MTPARGLLVGAVGIALASCIPSGTSNQVPSGPAGQCPTGFHSTIDRINFVVMAGIEYEATMASTGRALTNQDLGKPFGRVRCELTDLQFDPSYNELQNGNSGFLPPGTVLYAVNGYAPSFRIAAINHSQVVLYEADRNSRARWGWDLLDLAGKVSTISIDDDSLTGPKLIATVSDRATVDRLVGLLLTAPVNQRSVAGHAGDRYFLVFKLNDGTAVMRAYFRDSGEVQRGILTPADFRTAIDQAVFQAR